MKLPSVITALGHLCLMLADGIPVPQDESPKIIGSDKIKIKAHPGRHRFLYCEASTNPKDVTLIYWLVNGCFPEDLDSSNRIMESEPVTFEEGTIIQRSLLLKNVTSEDFKSNYSCLVTNAAGITQKNIVLEEREETRKTRENVQRTIL